MERPPHLGGKSQQIRGLEILDEINSTQAGWHQQIATLFDQRSKEQYDVMATIRKMEADYAKMNAAIAAKDKEIESLKDEVRNLDAHRPKYEIRGREIDEQVNRISNTLRERQQHARALREELGRMGADMKSYSQRSHEYEVKINNCAAHLRQLESSGRGYAPLSDDSEINKLRNQFRDVKQYNSRVLEDIKARENEIDRLRRILEKNRSSQRTAAQKEDEIRLLRAKVESTQRVFDEHQKRVNAKNLEIQRLEAEVKRRKKQFNNAVKAKSILTKKVVILSQNEHVDMAKNYHSENDDDEQDELAELRAGLSRRITELTRMFAETSGSQLMTSSVAVAGAGVHTTNHTVPSYSSATTPATQLSSPYNYNGLHSDINKTVAAAAPRETQVSASVPVDRAPPPIASPPDYRAYGSRHSRSPHRRSRSRSHHRYSPEGYRGGAYAYDSYDHDRSRHHDHYHSHSHNHHRHSHTHW